MSELQLDAAPSLLELDAALEVAQGVRWESEATYAKFRATEVNAQHAVLALGPTALAKRAYDET